MYSYQVPEDKKDMYALSRAEDVDASYKDLSEVCGRIRNKNTAWAVSFLEAAADGLIPILYKRHNKNLGHRKELGGAKGRYPKKAAKAVLKTLQSAIANSVVKGMSEDLVIVHAAANQKHVYPRLAPKGRRFRQNYSISRIEIIVKEKVETTPESRKQKLEKLRRKKAPAPETKTEAKSEPKGEIKTEAPGTAKITAEPKQDHSHETGSEHKHEHTHGSDAEKKIEKKAERKPRKTDKGEA